MDEEEMLVNGLHHIFWTLCIVAVGHISFLPNTLGVFTFSALSDHNALETNSVSVGREQDRGTILLLYVP
jgi:hypothetical protein